MKLDFHELADGLRRNNVGLDFVEVDLTASIVNGQVVVQGTGQRFPLFGDPPKETAVTRQRFKVVGYKAGEPTALEVMR